MRGGSRGREKDSRGTREDRRREVRDMAGKDVDDGKEKEEKPRDSRDRERSQRSIREEDKRENPTGVGKKKREGVKGHVTGIVKDVTKSAIASKVGGGNVSKGGIGKGLAAGAKKSIGEELDKGYDKVPKKKNNRINPFSYKSVKENVIERGVDKAAKIALDKYAVGTGTIIEKVHGMATGKDRVEYSKLAGNQGKLVIILLSLFIVVMAWLLMFIMSLVILFGAALLLMDDDGSGGGSRVDDTEGDSIGDISSGKGKGMPPELIGKFLWPNMERVTSTSGLRDIGFGPGDHEGTDMAHRTPGKTGVKMYPIAPGTVYHVVGNKSAKPNMSGGWGNYVRVDHGGYTSLYGHLEPNAPVKVGDKVGIDTVIGIMGNSGRSTGHHLHLEIFKGGQADHRKMKTHWRNALFVLSCTDTKPAPLGVGMRTECYEYQKRVRGIE